jgi:tRNA-2-methylthio-N6-dimethylallyladenosine synthase
MRFFIETYGCQMNVSDSELIISILRNAGMDYASNIEDADIIMFNTCSVRQHAEDRVLGRISNEVSRKMQKPDLLIGVIGCMAQRLGEELRVLNKKIDFVVGVDNYKNLPLIISRLNAKQDFIAEISIHQSEVYDDLFPVHSGEHIAFVTIMRGCNNFCSYCIVPYTRGRERSRSVDSILQEISDTGEKGFQDITLLGQNVNSYHYQGIHFPELLKKANQLDSIQRLRFVTSHPKDLCDDLIKVMSDNNKVCEHIHLPMQSGDNAILNKMNRGYTIEHYIDLVCKLRQAIPEIAITTDIIAGFPGETEDQFYHTYKAMEQIEFDYAFTFKYSNRSGTKASDFPDQITEDIRLLRLQKLIKLQEQITNKKYSEQIGKVKEIYVEKISKKSHSEVSGKSRDFKITVFPGKPDLIGKTVKVKITDATGWTLKGEQVQSYLD